MRVLVTRPTEQAFRTVKRVLALGHQPVLAPVLEIVPTGAAIPDGVFDFVIATSAQAFAGWTPLPALREVPIACVGEKTAEAARMLGFTVEITAPRANILAERLTVGNGPKSVLYLAGRERKPLLEDCLRAAGWRLDIAETYEARPVAVWPPEVATSLNRGEIDAVLHYSPRSAALALGVIGCETASRLSHYCLSPEIAAVCRVSAPVERIFTALQPDEAALMTLLGPAPASREE
jgi:uroporphyrinogen-III synthase